jgi:hypothetical protein
MPMQRKKSRHSPASSGKTPLYFFLKASVKPTDQEFLRPVFGAAQIQMMIFII